MAREVLWDQPLVSCRGSRGWTVVPITVVAIVSPNGTAGGADWSIVATVRIAPIAQYRACMSKPEPLHDGAPGDPTRKDFTFSENNFDLIRLVAASEVAFRHAVHHLSPERESGPLFWILDLVPGVPIFFFLSGFLLSRSWERSPSVTNYARNRLLRLLPALWLCTALTLVMLFGTGYLTGADWSPLKLGAWVVCQATAFQFWNPDFLRGFGCGVVNGSLWTISVEIQFYCALVLMYLGLRKLSARRFDAVLIAMVVIFGAAYQWKFELQAGLADAFGSEIAGKLFLASFVPWIFVFLLGALAQRHAASVVRWACQHRLAIIGATAAAILSCKHVFGLPVGNNLPAPLVPMLGCCVLSLAYGAPGVSHRILRGNDCSYGAYVYHMPIVNLALWCGGAGSMIAIMLSLAATGSAAVLSWRFVERPFLRRKRPALGMQ